MKTTICCAALLAGILPAGSAPLRDSCRVYFGTTAQGDDHGIYMAQLDMQTGQLSTAVRASDAVRPGYLIIHPNGQNLYATGGAPAGPGVLRAFHIEEPSGMLRTLNTQSSGGASPCHLSVDPSGKNLLVANYRGGSCAVLPILGDGSLAPTSSIQKHAGSSIDPKRQQAPFAHSMQSDPTGRFAIATDLGTDKIMFYRLNAESGTLTPNNPPFFQTPAGGGPRHFTFHPNGKFAYADLELTSRVIVFTYEAGCLTEIQNISTLPDEFTEKNTASEILTTPDGRFLYVGNRGHNSIAVFSIDPVTGKLTARGRESSRGKTPRGFNIDPTGTFLIVANANSSNAAVFRIDPQTGQLTFTGSKIRVPNAICVQFLPVP